MGVIKVKCVFIFMKSLSFSEREKNNFFLLIRSYISYSYIDSVLINDAFIRIIILVLFKKIQCFRTEHYQTDNP